MRVSFVLHIQAAQKFFPIVWCTGEGTVGMGQAALIRSTSASISGKIAPGSEGSKLSQSATWRGLCLSSDGT